MVAQHVYDNYMRSFNLDLPLWKQYYYFWVSLFHGDLGTSILQFPTPVIVDHRQRGPVHARAADPGDPAQLVRGQQARRARGAQEGPRQHAAARSATC